MDLNVGEAKINQVSPLATSPGGKPGGEYFNAGLCM